MNKNKLLILAISFLFSLPSFADTTAVNILSTYVVGTITFDVTGNLTTTIDPLSGMLGSGLFINYSMLSNKGVKDLQLKARVTDSTGGKVNAFYSTGGTKRAQTFFLVLANADSPPTLAAINNCRRATSTATSNENAIAYSGVVTISRSEIKYDSSGFYEFEIKKNKVIDLNLSIVTTPKAGTFNSTSSLDEPGDYIVEIYIDAIP